MDGLSLGVAFTGGVLSFLSPCVLPLALVYVVNIAGATSLTPEASRRRTVLHSVAFVIGFTSVFVALGASLGLIGGVVPTTVLYRVAGSVLVVFGVWLLLARRVSWLNYEMRFKHSFDNRPGYVRSLGLGAAFALGWTPCVGPILAGILALASGTGTVWQGSYLLLAYSVGLGLPFIAIGLVMGSATPVISWLSRRAGIVSVISGILLIVVGIGLLTGTLTRLIGLLTV